MRRALALVLLALGCASEQTVPLTPSEPAPGLAARILPVVALRWESQPDLPDETGVRPEGVPVSLTAGDGTGLEIASLSASAVVEDPLAFTELHFVFKNPSPRAIEGRFEITLPPEATISRFAMRQSWGWQEGEVVELQAARQAYEDFLHRRSDPALLEKQAGNRFQARVFPIPASGEKEIVFSYSQEIARSRDPYRVHLRGLPRIGKLDLRVLLDKHEQDGTGRRSFEIHQTDFKPDHDFAIPLPSSPPGVTLGLRQDRLAVARVTPLTEAAPDPVTSLLVLFDTSASRALGFRAEVERLGQLLEAIRKTAGGGAPLTVACFDQEVEVIHEGLAGELGPKHLEAILARKPLGASDLGKALHFATTPRGARKRLLLVTDGVVTAGETDSAELRGLVGALRRAGVERLDAVVDGGIRDTSLVKQLAVGGLSRDGVVLDGGLPAATLAERLGQRSSSGIQVKVPGSAWVWPRVLDGVQPGDQQVVFADLPEGQPFQVELAGGARTVRYEVTTRPVERPLLERAMVGAEIRRLMADHGATEDEKARAGIKQRIIGLSTKHRVLSDFTALLVLETDEDYARFNIDRRALANILTVGPSGVELLDRNKPLQVAAEVPAATAAAAPATRDGDGAADEKDVAKEAVAEHREQKAAHADKKKAGDASGAKADEDRRAAAQPPRSPPPPPQASASAADAPLPPPPPPPPAPRPPMGQVSVGPAAGAPAPSSAPRAARAPVFDSGSASTSFNGGGEHGGAHHGVPRARPRPDPTPAEDPETNGPPPYTGQLAEAMSLLASGRAKDALDIALRWHDAEPGDVLPLVAMGEAWEALGQKSAAARAYGSIIDLFPARADLRRFAGARLLRLGLGADGAFDLVLDTFRQAVVERPDHPQGHRFFAYALARAGRQEDAFSAIVSAARRTYPSGRFAGIERILRDDVGILAAAWIRAQPARRQEILDRLAHLRVTLPTRPSLRFLLNWETDANDVDFHIRDARGGHAFYQRRALASGGELYADVTTGYGPECFTIEGPPRAFPYRLSAHYYARGPMGYGMGNLEIVEHDGRGGLKFDERPFVVMTDRAFVQLGAVTGPLRAP